MKGAYTLMRRDFSTEQFQHFVENLKDSFRGDLQGQTRRALEAILKADSEQQMEKHIGLKWHERPAEGERRIDYRNGCYVRNYVTPVGTIQVQVSRTRQRSFLPQGIRALERRSPEVAELIRQAFLRGISTRAVGRVVALLTEERVSAQTVSRLTQALDGAVRAFHTAPLDDDWAYLIFDGVWIKVRRSFGPQRVLLLVVYGVRPNGERQLLAFVRARGESQAAWEGFLFSLVERGLRGQQLQLIITDGCPGLAAAIQVMYAGVLHQRCWVHKMRNLGEGVRRRDREAVKRDAQKIYRAPGLREARQAFGYFQQQWQGVYPRLVRRLAQDLPELLHFYAFPRPLWKKLRTTNAIERCFVEVRRRTRPMVVFTNVASVDRIIYAIFSRFNEEWRNRTLKIFTHAA